MASNRHIGNTNTTTVPTSDGATRELEKEAFAQKQRAPVQRARKDSSAGVVSLGKAGDGAPEEAEATQPPSDTDA